MSDRDDDATAATKREGPDVYYVAMLDARALWDTGDHKRAVDLATKARDGFTKLGDKDQAKDAGMAEAARALTAQQQGVTATRFEL